MFKPQSRIFLLLSLAIATACNSGEKKTESKGGKGGPIAIDVSIANETEFANVLEANGNVLAQDFVELKTEVSGRITYLNIKEGTRVSAGTLLVKLNDEDLQAQIKKYKSQLEIAKKNEARLKRLLDADGVNAAEYDLALNQVNNISADIEYTEALIRKTEIRAPFDGVIGLRNVSMGALVSQEFVLATLQATDGLKVDFVLPESYAQSVVTGAEVVLYSDIDKQYKAKIIGVEPQINTATRNLKIRAVLIEKTEGLKPGGFVKVIFNEGQTKKRIMVKSNSIIPETRFKKMAVIKNGKVVMTTVETGIRNEGFVEITNGLNPGDTFAVNGLLYLKPDAEVSIRKVR